jgi:hypothetical protein
MSAPFLAKLIQPNGFILPVEPRNGRAFTLEELQSFVGGYVEVITPPSRNGAIMAVNEEGKFRGLALNTVATRIWQQFAGPGSPRMSDPVVGTVLLCHDSQIE